MIDPAPVPPRRKLWLTRTDIGERSALAVLVVGTIAYAALYAWLSVTRHAAFQSHAFDLGNMDQAVWSTLHGHLLRFTDMTVGHVVLTSRLAIHVEPLLAALAPLYLIHSGPETLLVIQAVVVSSGAVPAYLLGRAALDRAWLALAFPLAYLLHPSLQNLLLDDFHAVAFSAALLLWASYFLYGRRIGPFLLCALLAMATKEEVGLVVACLGIWAVLLRRPLVGLTCMVGGIAWFLVLVSLVIPHFNPAGHSPYLGRYSYLGHGLAGIARGAASHPRVVLHTLTSQPRLEYLLVLLHPFGFTPLLAPALAAVALPALLINMLSADPTMYSGYYQYSAEIIPLLLAASILGIAWLERTGRERGVRGASWLAPSCCALLAVAALADSRIYGFSPLAAGYLVPSGGAHQALERRLLALIPAGAPVAAADEIEPHVAERPWVYLLPTVHPRNGPRAKYLVLDASVPSLPTTPRRLHAVAMRALRSGYGVRAAADGVLLLRYGARRRRLPASFFSFMFRVSARRTGADVRWRGLALTSFVLHPRTGAINRSRPAIQLESYWRVAAPLPGRVHIAFALSPVYEGAHPPFGPRWTVESDSPTWDWLPLARWPRGRTIRADSLSLLPPAGAWGKVDVAVVVRGAGPVTRTASAAVVAPGAVRVGTITVRP